MTSNPGLNAGPYRVALDVFEGPLDLLLRLIERQELDITLVSLALVTDQYLEYIAALEISAESLADFLVIAAKLLVIKSRSLLPPPTVINTDPDEDIGEQLKRQLAEYKRFKLAALQLRGLEQRGWRTYLRLAPAPKIARRVPDGALAPASLQAAFVKAVTEQPVIESVDTVIQPVAVYISDCISTIRAMLAQQPVLPLSQVLGRANSRLEVIVLFLALLELIKQQHVQVTQEGSFGEINLEPRSPGPDGNSQIGELEAYGEVETE